MKNIKYAVLFLLLTLISSFSCQSFGNFGADFVINLEGDFDKDIIINALLIGSCNTGPLSWQAHFDIKNDTAMPTIKILPNAHYNETLTQESFSTVVAGVSDGALQIAINRYRKNQLDKQREPALEQYFLAKHKDNENNLQQLKELYDV